MTDIRQAVKEYYSSLTSKEDLQTGVCTCSSAPDYAREIMEQLPQEVLDRFYGCGSPLPLALDGCTVLDLGCGCGRDVFVLSKLVGETGRVIGVDMNEDQLSVARKYQDKVAKTFGYAKSNVQFIQGYIEDLASLGIKDESVDVVVSNCVINLSPFKEQVFAEIWRVLKGGGELYFSDVFASRRIPQSLQENPLLRGECISGAMYIEDFRRLMRKTGWEDFRYMSTTKSSINNAEVASLFDGFAFYSRTVRAFKLPEYLEDICEQYGQKATYLGGIANAEEAFDLDDHHHFVKGEALDVCGNSCAMVQNTRFGKYFKIEGDRCVHYGPFEGCGNAGLPAADDSACCSSGGCCC